MRVLMLAHRIPYPPHTGDKVRAYHIARHLARHHELTLGFIIDDPGDARGIEALREDVSDLEFVQVPKARATLKSFLCDPLRCWHSQVFQHR